MLVGKKLVLDTSELLSELSIPLRAEVALQRFYIRIYIAAFLIYIYITYYPNIGAEVALQRFDPNMTAFLT